MLDFISNSMEFFYIKFSIYLEIAHL